MFNFAITTSGGRSTTGFINGDGGTGTLNVVGFDRPDLSYDRPLVC